MTRLLWDELEQDLPEVCPSEIIGWLKLMLIEAGQLAEGGGHRASRCGTRTSQIPKAMESPSTFLVEQGDRWRVGLACHGRSRADTVRWMGAFFFSSVSRFLETYGASWLTVDSVSVADAYSLPKARAEASIPEKARRAKGRMGKGKAYGSPASPPTSSGPGCECE